VPDPVDYVESQLDISVNEGNSLWHRQWLGILAKPCGFGVVASFRIEHSNIKGLHPTKGILYWLL
jgi:hypothetical protein